MTRPRCFLAIVLSVILTGSPAAMATVNKHDVILLLANSKRLQLNSQNSPLRQAMASFLEDFTGDNRVALLTFNEHTLLILPFTSVTRQEAEALLKPLNKIQPGRRFSNSAAAMERAIEEFNKGGRREASKSIVFITDNPINTGDKTRDLRFARWLRELVSEEAAAAGIRIHGIAYSETADVQSIEALAKKTGGRYERASGAGDLQTALKRLSTTITSQQLPIEPSQLTSASQALFNPEKLPRAETTTVATQQEFTLPIKAQPSEIYQGGIETPLQTQADRHETQPNTTGIEKLMSEMPSINLVTAWITSNKILLAASITAFVVIMLGVFFVFRLRRRSPLSAHMQMRHSVADTVPPAHLEDMSGITNQRVYDISGKLTRIRRAPAEEAKNIKNIVISDHLISRDHAFIEYEDSGYWISDRSSANGTFVNDEKVIDKKLLKYGDHIRFAKYEFKFVMPPQAAMSATIALTSISDESHSTQSDEATLAAASSPLAKSDGTPRPRYGGEDRSSVRTPNLSPPEQQDYEPTATGSSIRPAETAESPRISPDMIQKLPEKDSRMDTVATPFESDDQRIESEADYVSGGTAKLPEYHQGDTVMFRRSGDKKDINRAIQRNEPAINLGKTATTEDAGETSEKPEYRRGGTKLFRPEHEAFTDVGNYPNQPESESNQMNIEGEDISKDQRQSPQYGHSDTIAISREHMQQILRHRDHQAKTHGVSAEIARDDGEQAFKTLSQPDQAKAAFSSGGDIEQPMTMGQPDDEAKTGRNTLHAGRDIIEEDQQTQYNRGDTVAIPHEEIERMIQLAQREDKMSNTPVRNIPGDVDEGATNLTEYDHDRGDTEDLGLDQINEQATSTTHFTPNESPGVSSDISLTANPIETKTIDSPFSTNVQQENHQGDIDQTRAVSSSADDLDKTGVISTERRSINLASNRHQGTTEEGEDEKTKERPFHSDK